MVEAKMTLLPHHTRSRASSAGLTGRLRSYEPMRRPSYRRNRMVPVLVVLLMASAVLAVSVRSAFDKEPARDEATVSATFPMIVWGTVYDSLGAPVVGAEVNVTTKDGSTVIAYHLTTSDDIGFYQVTFGNDEWNTDNTIEVVAKIDVFTATNSTTADGSGDQNIDVHFSVPIPEFGVFSWVVLGVVIVLVAHHRRRSEHP